MTPDAPHPRRRPGTAFPAGSLAPLAHALMLGGATVAVFLAGRPQEGAMGVFLVCAGVAMIVCPPRVKVEGRLWTLSAALVGGAALALLPERFLAQPAWRRTLDATPAIAMPGTISVNPALTGFWLAVLALSLLAGLFLLAQPIRSRWLLAFALTGATAAGVYAALAIYAKQTGWHYPFASDATFGFFPNRNHTATFLFVGSLLAVGALGVVLREGRWAAALLAGAALAVCGTALAFFSPSRGGIVFLLVGVFLWIAGLGRRNRDVRLVVSFAAIVLAVGLLFLFSGGEVRDRLLGRNPPPSTAAASPGGDTPDPMHNLSTDFRLKIYRDAFRAVRDFPLTGLGLGGFPLVFAQYRQASLTDAQALHPESDWLMLVAEAGAPAAFCLFALIALAARRLGPERDHPYWPLRWGCAIAAGAAALHGLVDVPMHRVQLGWWVLAAAGLALQSGRAGTPGRARWQQAFFMVGGLAALTLGGALVRAQWFGGPPLPPFVAEKAQADILARFQRNDTKGATDLARQAVKDSPMAAPLYYQFGTLLLHFEDTDAEVDGVFLAQRRLNPAWPAIPLQQGDAWLSIDPDRTVTLWLEAFARRRQVDGALGVAPEQTAGFYRQLLDRAKAFPAVQRALGRLAGQRPADALAWLEGMGSGLKAEDWDRFTSSPDFLRSFSADERQRFLMLWYARAGGGPVDHFVGDHPDWQAAAWPVHLRELTGAGQFETAVREAAAHYQISLDLNLNAAPPVGAAVPDPASESVLDAFARYWRADNHITARRVLREAAQAAGSKPLPPEYWQTRLALAAQDQDWQAAWEALKNALRSMHPAERLP